MRIVLVFALALLWCGQADARWRPGPITAPWQLQLQGTIDTSLGAAVYDIDGFDVPASTIAELHEQGAKVLCYIDAGSWESYRPDADAFPERVLGKVYEGYPDERWLDIRRLKLLRPILDRRFARCRRKGFDAIDPDNVNGSENDTGFPLTRADQLRFNRFLARRVHRLGLSIALKNDGPQAAKLVGDYDMAVVESCFEFDECDQYQVFPDHGKPVFAVEYELEPGAFCAEAAERRFSAIRKDTDLFASPWQPC